MQEKRAIRTFFFLCEQFMFRLSNMWTLQTFSRKKDCKDGTKDERKGILMRNYCLGGAQWLWSERTQRIKIAVVARTTIYTLFLYEYAMMLFQIDQRPNLTLNSYKQEKQNLSSIWFLPCTLFIILHSIPTTCNQKINYLPIENL